MFDFSFAELILFMSVALMIIGPERLPKVARTAGHVWGRMQRYAQNVKTDISSDLAIQEARQLQASIKEDISAIEKSTHETVLTAEQKILQAQYSTPPAKQNPYIPSKSV